jgi:hypothetical protein
MTCISTNLFFVGPTLFVGFLVVHIILVESPNKTENARFFFFLVLIVVFYLGLLLFIFLLKLKES